MSSQIRSYFGDIFGVSVSMEVLPQSSSIFMGFSHGHPNHPFSGSRVWRAGKPQLDTSWNQPMIKIILHPKNQPCLTIINPSLTIYENHVSTTPTPWSHESQLLPPGHEMGCMGGVCSSVVILREPWHHLGTLKVPEGTMGHWGYHGTRMRCLPFTKVAQDSATIHRMASPSVLGFRTIGDHRRIAFSSDCSML